MLVLAAQIDEVCDDDWLCRQIFQTTENELLSRVAGAGSTLLRILLVLVIAWLVVRVLKRLVGRFSARFESRIEGRLDRAQERGAMSDSQRFRGRRRQRLHAITGVMRGAISTVVWLIALLQIVGLLGIPLQPILAGAGLFGIVVGFGAQQLVRDVLAGIAMLIEDQYGVGDWIEVEGKFGIVERVGLRSTAFRDVDGTVHHVLNGYIQRVGNLSQEWARATLDVPVALDVDIPMAKALIHKVASDLAADEVWGQDIIGPPELWGVQEFGPAGIKIRVVVPTKPLRNFDVTRQLRERLKSAFEQGGVRMPPQLIDIGGQRDGYAVLTKDTTQDEPDRPPRRRRSLVPPDVGPLDRPPEPSPSEPAPDPTVAMTPAQPSRDLTAELRIQRGPEPRPD